MVKQATSLKLVTVEGQIGAKVAARQLASSFEQA